MAMTSPYRKEYLEDTINKEAQAARNAIIERTARAALLDVDDEFPTLDQEQWLHVRGQETDGGDAHRALHSEEVNILLGFNHVKETPKKSNGYRRAKSSRGVRPKSGRSRKNGGGRPSTSHAGSRPTLYRSPSSSPTPEDTRNYTSRMVVEDSTNDSDRLRRYIAPLQHRKLTVSQELLAEDHGGTGSRPRGGGVSFAYPLDSITTFDDDYSISELGIQGRVKPYISVSQIDRAVSSLQQFTQEDDNDDDDAIIVGEDGYLRLNARQTAYDPFKSIQSGNPKKKTSPGSVTGSFPVGPAQPGRPGAVSLSKRPGSAPDGHHGGPSRASRELLKTRAGGEHTAHATPSREMRGHTQASWTGGNWRGKDVPSPRNAAPTTSTTLPTPIPRGRTSKTVMSGVSNTPRGARHMLPLAARTREAKAGPKGQHTRGGGVTPGTLLRLHHLGTLPFSGTINSKDLAAAEALYHRTPGHGEESCLLSEVQTREVFTLLLAKVRSRLQTPVFRPPPSKPGAVFGNRACIDQNRSNKSSERYRAHVASLTDPIFMEKLQKVDKFLLTATNHLGTARQFRVPPKQNEHVSTRIVRKLNHFIECYRRETVAIGQRNRDQPDLGEYPSDPVFHSLVDNAGEIELEGLLRSCDWWTEGMDLFFGLRSEAKEPSFPLTTRSVTNDNDPTSLVPVNDRPPQTLTATGSVSAPHPHRPGTGRNSSVAHHPPTSARRKGLSATSPRRRAARPVRPSTSQERRGGRASTPHQAPLRRAVSRAEDGDTSSSRALADHHFAAVPTRAAPSRGSVALGASKREHAPLLALAALSGDPSDLPSPEDLAQHMNVARDLVERAGLVSGTSHNSDMDPATSNSVDCTPSSAHATSPDHVPHHEVGNAGRGAHVPVKVAGTPTVQALGARTRGRHSDSTAIRHQGRRESSSSGKDEDTRMSYDIPRSRVNDAPEMVIQQPSPRSINVDLSFLAPTVGPDDFQTTPTTVTNMVDADVSDDADKHSAPGPPSRVATQDPSLQPSVLSASQDVEELAGPEDMAPSAASGDGHASPPSSPSPPLSPSNHPTATAHLYMDNDTAIDVPDSPLGGWDSPSPRGQSSFVY